MNKKIINFFCALAAAMFILSGCGGSSDTDLYDADDYADDYSVSEEASYDYDDFLNEADVGSNDEIYETKSADSAYEEDGTTEDAESLSERKLVKTVDLSVETREFDALLENIDSKITELNGYAESINVSGNSYDSSYGRRNASIVARIPADKLDEFVSKAFESSNITSKSENTEDVTLQYSDIESHIGSLKIEQDRLNELLAKADSVDTIIALENRLTEVRYELESYESSLKLMKNQVDYSTVCIDISEVRDYKQELPENPTFAEKLKEKFVTNCEFALGSIQDFVIGFISFLPILLVIIIILGVLGGIIYLIIRLVMFIFKKRPAGRTIKKTGGRMTASAVETRKEINNVTKDNTKSQKES